MSIKEEEKGSKSMTDRQFKFLSAELVISLTANTVVVLVAGTTMLNRIDARVLALEAQQVTDGRIARIEEKLNVLKDTLLDVQRELRMERIAAARDERGARGR